MNCGTCKFWADGKFKLMANGNTSPDDAKNENAGTCRRYAPSARQNNFRTWPVTVASDFCHDYLPHPGVDPMEVTKVVAVDESRPAPSVMARLTGRGRKKST